MKHIQKIISRLVNLSRSSAKVKSLKVKQKLGTTHTYFPCLNLFFYAPHSSLKTTLADEIAKKFEVEVLIDTTGPGLVGTIDCDSRNGVRSDVWNRKDKLLIIDEFIGDSHKRQSLIKVLLKVTENSGQYSKSIGMAVKKEINEGNDNEYFRVKNGTISLKVRIPTMIFTMFSPYVNGNELMEALLSRFIVLEYNLTKDSLDKILDGNKLLKLKEIKVEKERLVLLKDFNYIIKFVKTFVGKKDIGSDLLRYISDCVKVYGVLGYHSDIDYELILRLKMNNGLLFPLESPIELQEFIDKVNKAKW